MGCVVDQLDESPPGPETTNECTGTQEEGDWVRCWLQIFRQLRTERGSEVIRKNSHLEHYQAFLVPRSIWCELQHRFNRLWRTPQQICTLESKKCADARICHGAYINASCLTEFRTALVTTFHVQDEVGNSVQNLHAITSSKGLANFNLLLPSAQPHRTSSTSTLCRVEFLVDPLKIKERAAGQFVTK